MNENVGIQILNKYNVEINLPNEIGYERIAMACSATFAKMVGFGAERIEDLKSAVAEACTISSWVRKLLDACAGDEPRPAYTVAAAAAPRKSRLETDIAGLLYYCWLRKACTGEYQRVLARFLHPRV